jgi:hypothetical protein
MVKEWLCGRIGTQMGLPIPPIELVYMDVAAGQFSVYPEAADLAACPGFGSKLVEPADILTVASIGEVAAELRAAILLFDWWVLNEDRHDGNTNLLWQPSERRLHVIDHNLTFGSGTPEDFWRDHIFRRDRDRISLLRPGKLAQMTAIIEQLPNLWRELPDKWQEGCLIQLGQIDAVLRRCQSEAFWP